jgi:glutamyl/glutaminyl-tRNA synthetase
LWPLRVALSGKDKSPGPFEIIEVIDKEETLERLKIALEKME